MQANAPKVDFEIDDAVDKLARVSWPRASAFCLAADWSSCARAQMDLAVVSGERGARIVEARTLGTAVRHAQVSSGRRRVALAR